MTDKDLTVEELLVHFEEMWESATIGDTWKLNDETVQACNQIHKLTENDGLTKYKAGYDQGRFDEKMDRELEQPGERIPQSRQVVTRKWIGDFTHAVFVWKPDKGETLSDVVIRWLKEFLEVEKKENATI